MNFQKLLLAFLGGGIVMLGLSYLWHRVLMADFYSPDVAMEPDMIFIFAGYGALALLMAIIYPLGYRGGSPTSEGPRFGALMGLVAFVPFSLIVAALMPEWSDMKIAAVDWGWHIVEQGVGGLVIALIYGRPKAAAAAE